MAKLIRDKALVEDSWTLVKEATDTGILTALPGRDLIVPLRLWKLYPQQLAEHSGQVTVWLNSDQEPREIGPELSRLPLVALNFPVFTDGRSYSSARELRQTFGYTGEIRAIGDVLRDQIFYMHRCGFNAFAPRFDQDLNECLQAFNDFSTGYQSSVDQPQPLFRRRRAG